MFRLFRVASRSFSEKSSVGEIPAVDLSAIEEALGHKFSDPLLLETALLHRGRILSPAAQKSSRPQSNERLEWLGDSVLELVVRDFLFARFPGHVEGDLTLIKQSLVSAPALSYYFRAFFRDLDLRLFRSVFPHGLRDGKALETCKGRAFEAILGAVYLDNGGLEGSGLKAVKEVMTSRVNFEEFMEIGGTNWKLLLARAVKSHSFEVVATVGKNENLFHTVKLTAITFEDSVVECTATARSIREAEMDAARQMVKIKHDDKKSKNETET